MSEELTPEICVIGGGPGGIAAALEAAGEGVPVVLVERGRVGGANLSHGSILSKALTAAAGQFDMLRRGPAAGARGAPLTVDLGAVHEHVRAAGEGVAQNLSAERLIALGVEVVSGEARFADQRTAVVGETQIRARNFILATGSLAAAPSNPALAAIDHMTPETLLSAPLPVGPLIVAGASPYGLELAQACHRLGITTTVVDEATALGDADPELAAIVLERLRSEGLRIEDGVRISEAAATADGIRVTVAGATGEHVLTGQRLLVMGGRIPNVAGLGLDAAGVACNAEGIRVDGMFRTTNHHIFAIGDAVAGPASAARAEYEAGRVIRYILYRQSPRTEPAPVPISLFTDPGMASVGLGEADARLAHKDLRVIRTPFVDNDLAQIERAPAGVLKVMATTTGKILGAAAVGRGANELIGLFSLAIASGLGLDAMLGFVPPYPSRAAIAHRVALAGLGRTERPSWRRKYADIMRKLG